MEQYKISKWSTQIYYVQAFDVKTDAVTRKRKKSSRGETAVRSQAFSSVSEMFPPPGDQTSLGGLREEGERERDLFLCPFSFSVTFLKWEKKVMCQKTPGLRPGEMAKESSQF